MKISELNVCYKQAKRNSKNISDFVRNMKFEIFLCEQRKSDISKV